MFVVQLVSSSLQIAQGTWQRNSAACVLNYNQIDARVIKNPSISTMEQPRYYDVDNDGTYCVHFANKQGLSVERIKDIFSEFGNVVTVRKAGDDYGFRFVKFELEDDAKRCIEAMKSHKTIKILPKRPKQQRNDQNNAQQYQNNWTTNKQEPWKPREQQNTNNNGKFNNYQNNENHRSNKVSPEKSQQSSETFNPPINASYNTSCETKIEKSEEIVEKKEEWRKITGNSQIGTANISSFENIDNNSESREANHESVPILNEPTIAEKSLGCPQNYQIIVNEAAEMPELTSSTSNFVTSPKLEVPTIPLDDISGEIPGLINSNSAPEKKNLDEGMIKDATPLIKKNVNNEEIYTAEEIYVANIPTDFGVGYICHLFKKHDPIWVDPIKYVQSTAIRFCIVSFPSAEQANACEAQFDGHELGGKTLIILRPQTLRDIAAS